MLNRREVHIALVDYYTSHQGFQLMSYDNGKTKYDKFSLNKKSWYFIHNGFYECDDLIDEIFEQDVFTDNEDEYNENTYL